MVQPKKSPKSKARRSQREKQGGERQFVAAAQQRARELAPTCGAPRWAAAALPCLTPSASNLACTGIRPDTPQAANSRPSQQRPLSGPRTLRTHPTQPSRSTSWPPAHPRERQDDQRDHSHVQQSDSLCRRQQAETRRRPAPRHAANDRGASGVREEAGQACRGGGRAPAAAGGRQVAAAQRPLLSLALSPSLVPPCNQQLLFFILLHTSPSLPPSRARAHLPWRREAAWRWAPPRVGGSWWWCTGASMTRCASPTWRRCR